jgi:DNA-binding FrmR family transcriptional regulator
MADSSRDPGYIAEKDELRRRLRRIAGQVGGLERMVEDERYCIDILTQVSAVRAALDGVALELLDDHARHCLAGSDSAAERERLGDEMMDAIGRLLKSR